MHTLMALYRVKSQLKNLLFFFLILLTLLVNSIHENYPDEMDNILGGYLINHGVLPYTGFFTHHGPLAYYLASFLTFFAGQSFVEFRMLSAFFYFFIIFATYFLLNRIASSSIKAFITFFYIPLVVISATFIWSHMFLADPISAYLLIIAYGIVFLRYLQHEKLLREDHITVSITSSLALINSPTYSFVVLLLLVFIFLSFIKEFGKKKIKQVVANIFQTGILYFIPYFLFFVFLLLTNSFNDYIFQAINYNKNYYIYNYPRPPGSTSINPFRYAIVIFNNFFNSYYVLFAGIKNIDFINPFNVTLAFSNLALWVALGLRKKFSVLILSFLILVFSTVRSNPLNIHATDYQSTLYVMLGFFNSSMYGYLIKDRIYEIGHIVIKYIIIAFSILFIIFWFYTCIFLVKELWQMAYLRYMGQMPLIYDRPQVANLINDIVDKNSYCWVGPFEFEEIYYLDCKLPSRFHIFRRFFKDIKSFREEIISDYSKKRADVIVYRKKVFENGQEDSFFTEEILDRNYINLREIEDGKYIFKSSITKDYNLSKDFYLDKSKVKTLISNLMEKDYIEEKSY